MNFWILLAWSAVVTSFGPGGTSTTLSGGNETQASARPAKESYAAEILAKRRARDDEFRSRTWSALAVTAIAPLERPRVTIGSSPETDLRLSSPEVAAIHAEIDREKDSAGRPAFRLKASGGRVWTDADPPAEVGEIQFEAGRRVRIGRFIVYWENLGTFGPVLRALDYSTPAYTRFKGLSYFPPDPAFRVTARLIPYPVVKRVMIADTHRWRRPAWRFGEARFTLNRINLRLVLLLFTPQPGEKDTFFVAFTDETRGKETYPAARYLQPRFVSAGRLVLDFNEAINPLCAYNQGFACPLPPRENRLPAAIRAGEKIYPHAVGH
jgi:uncharacterized protein (DUF1684 family)